MSILPYQTRYDAYARWRSSYTRHPQLAAAKAEAAAETRKILRRISKDNIKQLGRQLGKIAHANPTVVLETVVSQVRLAIMDKIATQRTTLMSTFC